MLGVRVYSHVFSAALIIVKSWECASSQLFWNQDLDAQIQDLDVQVMDLAIQSPLGGALKYCVEVLCNVYIESEGYM